MSESPRTPDTWVGEPFAVSHILADELPAALGTIAAPRIYRVSAIFTRRPLPREVQLLEDPAVAARLAEAGYPAVRMHAEDRRLIIDGSSLHELQDGLARLIGQILVDIGRRASAEREANRSAPDEHDVREGERSARVRSVAQRISFNPERSLYT